MKAFKQNLVLRDKKRSENKQTNDAADPHDMCS